MRKLRIAYHALRERQYWSRFEEAERDPFGGLSQSYEIIDLYEKLTPHIQKIVDLSREGSQEHTEALRRLEILERAKVKAETYKKETKGPLIESVGRMLILGLNSDNPKVRAEAQRLVSRL